jgi:biotin carboxylase
MPAVIKPVDSGGQRGVSVIGSRRDLVERLPQTIAYSTSKRAILERYVEGSELNAIVVVRRGEPQLVTLSDRLRPPGPGFGVGWIHLYPSQLPAAALATAEAVAVAAVRALGLQDGIAFPQLLVTGERDVVVVEVAARIPAGQMADLVRLGVGVDLVDIALRQARGEEIPRELVEPRFERPLAIRFLTASPGLLPTGRVVTVDGLDSVRSAPGVLEAGLYIQLGETISPVQVDADRRGYVIATARDPQAALELADHAARRLRVEVADE